MTALHLDIRRKAYPRDGGEQEVIRGLTLDIAPGEFVALLGPSGCGKSTTLQIAAGLDTDFEGKVSPAAGAGQTMAYVFQQPRLLPWRTVQQNIELVFDQPGQHTADIADTLAAMDLGDAVTLFPGQLSLGMQRRVALARAFVLKPDLLLMDEPFVSLDESLASRLRGVLSAMLERHPAAVLFVTHDWREAVNLADRLVFMGGSPATITAQVQVDLPASVRNDPRAQDAFRQRHLAAMPDMKQDDR